MSHKHEHDRLKPQEHATEGHELHRAREILKQDPVGLEMKPGHTMKGMSEVEHHAMMMGDYRRRFWISLILTVPDINPFSLNSDLFGTGRENPFPR